MEKEIIEIFKYKVKDIIKGLDFVIDYHMNDYGEKKISAYIEEKRIWNWCLDILSETEAEVYNKKEE